LSPTTGRLRPLTASVVTTVAALVLVMLVSTSAAFAAGPAPLPCSLAGGGKYNCQFYPAGDGITAGAPVQASDGHRVGFLNHGTNWVICERVGSTLTSGPYQNNWWAWTEANDGQWGWVNALYGSGGDNFGPFGGVPACGANVGLPPGGQPPPPAGSLVPCTPIAGGEFSCTWYVAGNGSSGGSPVQRSDGATVGYLHKGTNWIVCEQTGAERSLGAFHNDWYGWTEADNGHWGWANALYASGGNNDAPFANVPVCGGAHGSPPSASPPTSTPPPPVQPPPVPGGGGLDATRRQIVAKALSEVGYNPDTDGCGRFNSIMCPGGVAFQEWCAVFATWTWQQGGVAIPILPYSGSPYTWAQQNTYVISPSATPRAGDLVFFGTGPGVRGHQSHHVAVVAQVLPSGAIVTVNGNWGGGDGHVATATFFPSQAVRAGEPAPIYGYASPVRDQTGGAHDADAITLTPQELIALIRAQDPRSAKRRQARLLRRHPAFAHMPYANGRITIEIRNYLRSGRVLLDVLYRGSHRAATHELRHFLARYHDRGHGYRVRYRKAS
jgi:CHAP domain